MLRRTGGLRNLPHNTECYQTTHPGTIPALQGYPAPIQLSQDRPASPSSSTRLSCLTSEAERGERASEQAAPPRPPGLDLAHRGLGCRALICASSQLYSGRDGSAPSCRIVPSDPSSRKTNAHQPTPCSPTYSSQLPFDAGPLLLPRPTPCSPASLTSSPRQANSSKAKLHS